MIYSIAILFLIATIIVIRYTDYKSLLVALMVLFLDTSVFAIILYIAKCGNYPYPSLPLMRLDYEGYLALSRLKIPFYWIIRIDNIGMAGFLACMPFILNTLWVDWKHRWIDFSALIIPLSYALLYDPIVRKNMLFHMYSLPADRMESFRLFINQIHILCGVCIILYMLIPIARLAAACVRSTLPLKKKQFCSLMVSLLLLDGVFLFLQYSFGQGADVANASEMLGFSGHDMQLLENHYLYIWFPVMIFVIANIMVISLMYFRVLEDYSIIQRLRKRKKNNEFIMNIQGIFHSFKSVMFSVNVIAKQLEFEDDDERKEVLVKRLIDLSEKHIMHLTDLLDIYKSPTVYTEPCEIASCIDRVIENRFVDADVRIEKQYCKNSYAVCDEHILEDVFANIIQNSVDAIKLAQREDGCITVEVTNEYEWVVVKITDNGIGISQKQIKKVFKAFYTTKGTSTNWGIGMNYVMKNIKAMRGIVYIKSKVNEYTAVSVLLRRQRGSSCEKDKNSHN